MRRIVRTDAAPKAIGPYSQAVLVDGWLFCSGQIPLDPATGTVVAAGDAAAQAERVLDNLAAVVKEAGGSLADAVKVTIYLKDMNTFAVVNDAYAKRFPGNAPPARATSRCTTVIGSPVFRRRLSLRTLVSTTDRCRPPVQPMPTVR